MDENEDDLDILNHGLFSEILTSKMLRTGISRKSVIKTMKFGLKSLEPNEMNHFCLSKIISITSNYLITHIDKEFLAKLKHIGLEENECLDIVISGLVNQNENSLYHLTINGIAVNKILNWGDPVLYTSEGLVKFFGKLKSNKSAIERIVQEGFPKKIQRESENIENQKLMNEATFTNQNSINCGCSLISGDNESHPKCVSSSFPISSQNALQKEDTLNKQIYIKEHLLLPLTWAITEVLKNKPIDTNKSIARLLLRWKYGSILPQKKQEILDFIQEYYLETD